MFVYKKYSQYAERIRVTSQTSLKSLQIYYVLLIMAMVSTQSMAVNCVGASFSSLGP